jgi:hypothetical protein
MKINFTKKHLNLNRIYALIASIGVFPVLCTDGDAWMVVVAILTPIVGVLGNVYQKQYQYITIENGSIRKNHLFRKEVQLSAIKTIEKYAESYILKTDTQKLRIDTSIIAADSLIALNAALEKLMLNGAKSMHIQTAQA